MSTEIATIEASMPVAVNPLDIAPLEFKVALQRRGDNRKALMEWVRSSLVENVDFGKIHFVANNKCDKGANCTNKHHFSKPVLFKPGAEKICGMLNVTATFPTLHEYEQAALSGVALQHLIVRCHLVTNGQVVADGIGARSLETDYGDINKALKMALKSAHIDATLRMAGLSEVFTQDLDTMEADANTRGAAPAKGSPVAPASAAKSIPLVPSGMHRGKPWADVARDYLEWCVKKTTGALADGAKAELALRDSLIQKDYEPDLPESFYKGSPPTMDIPK